MRSRQHNNCRLNFLSFHLKMPLRFLGSLALMFLFSCLAGAQNEPVSITILDDGAGDGIAPRFLGLSYEMSTLLPRDGQYYFDPHDQALINIFKTLGVKSLRVGANAVDDPGVSVPQEKDIDQLFNFARAADVKVIYSFRLKKGVPADSARLAKYIEAHDADVLDCYSIGNEPNFYLKTFDDYFAQWKLQYDAILNAVPYAMFDGPSVANHPPATPCVYPLELANAMFEKGHLALVSDHYYFLGRRNEMEKDPSSSRAQFLSNKVDLTYATAYARTGAKLAEGGVPYRIDELNSCARGGARDSSDTYASALWALDCTHWWAAHHILGMNYHTGEYVKDDGEYNASDYAAFLHQANGSGLNIRPLSYAMLAFTEGAHGRPINVKTRTSRHFNFTAYAYRDQDGSVYLTLINKNYGDKAVTASVSLELPDNMRTVSWERMDLVQKQQDIAAKTGIVLGGDLINSRGLWSGGWSTNENDNSRKLKILVVPASATILHFSAEMKPSPAALSARSFKE
jgi:hypothetical protein